MKILCGILQIIFLSYASQIRSGCQGEVNEFVFSCQMFRFFRDENM
jgi:hypothetical protein